MQAHAGSTRPLSPSPRNSIGVGLTDLGEDSYYFPPGRSMARRVHGERSVGLLYGQRALLIGALLGLSVSLLQSPERRVDVATVLDECLAPEVWLDR